METGEIRYTGRAFAQDADLAMGGKIMRGLVELITNCDDAYGPNQGDIVVTRIKREDGSMAISVGDNGPGLDPDGLKACFSVLGGKSSGFHGGDDVRGMFGRGAKDTAAFGRTTFESIKDGTYGILELKRSGNWTLDDRPASPEDHQRLGIPEGGSGLVATINAEVNPASVPPLAKLITSVTNHVQLRRISRDRQVLIRNLEPGKLRSSDYARWGPPSGTVIFDGEILISDYNAVAQLTLKRLASPSADNFGPYAVHGIEIHGSKAIYENSLFDCSGPEIRWIHGSVTCPAIDDLIREFDQHNGTNSNPEPLIRRDRDGLAREHPFTLALKKAVLMVLTPILDELKPNTDAPAGGAKLKNDLSQASKQLAALLESDIAKIDDTPLAGGSRPTAGAAIKIIPPQTTVRLGKRRTMTVLVDESLIPDPEILDVSTTDTGVCSVSSLTPFQLHSTFEGVRIANFAVSAVDLGRCVVTVHDGTGAFSASASVRVADDPGTEPEEPTELKWRNSSMSVASGKTRSITLEGPIELAPTGVLECRISIDGDVIELLDDVVMLRQNAEGWLTGKCRITGGPELGASTRITATSGTHSAEGSVRVSRPSGLEGLGLQIEIVDQSIGDFRASMREDDGSHVITIYARHGGLSDLIGGLKGNGEFANEEKREVRVAMTEIIGATIAEYLVIREAQRYPTEFEDADAVLAQRSKVLTRYLVPLQRLLVHSRD